MAPTHYTILRLWAVADDDDWYGLLSLCHGITRSEAKAWVRQSLAFYAGLDLLPGGLPRTSREYATLRTRIRKGDIPWEALN